jgi:hypothetical protein
MCKDDWLMRLGDHGRTVIMAVPPTADAMSGIHQQHDPRCEVRWVTRSISPTTGARERNRSEATAQSRRATGPDAATQCLTLMPRSTRRPSPRTGGPTSTRSRAVTRQVRGRLEHRPATRQEIVASRLPRSSQAALQGRLEPSARSDSGQSRGGFSEQTHGRASYFEVVGGCGYRCCARPDDSDCHWHAVGLD